jgi:hypothetical protein
MLGKYPSLLVLVILLLEVMSQYERAALRAWTLLAELLLCLLELERLEASSDL